MAIITTNMVTDEVTYQQEFYRQLYGDNWTDFITVDRNTDGYTQGILFEHKQNIISYGEAKALGQAIIYLTRFNRDGIPVPRYVCLVSQDEQKVYVYDMEKYMKYIDDIPTHANLKASTDDASFLNGKLGKRYMTINYEFSAKGLRKLSDFVERPAETLPVMITEHNVYGWSCYYYDHASQHKQKAEKKQFFDELRNPTATLKGFINPWTGVESDFKYIMDMLNDPMTQKKLGAFYTPPAYAKKAVELVKQAIARVPKGNDYVIIDRCAGTGNLEMYLDDGTENILSHVIVSTYELKEWMVLKERFGKRVRYIIPPIPDNPNDLPELNNDGFLRGANALTKEIIENPVIRQYLDNDKCTIILFENPPYAETTSIEFQRRGEGTKATSWKDNYIVTEMKKEISGTTTNDMGNVFIWSAFKYFLRQPTDSYIVFSPVKYWKAQHLINKKFMGGYAFNRRYFHTNIDACIMVAYWSNEEAKITELNIDAIDLDVNNSISVEETLSVKRIRTKYSDVYFDNRRLDSDINNACLFNLNGTEYTGNGKRIEALYSNNIIGYMAVYSSGFDNPDLHSSLLIGGRYDGNGFYLRSDNFLTKLPMFAASRYIRYNSTWTERARIMKSADKSSQYFADIKSGSLDDFLCKCLIFTCFEPQNHCRSLHGSDGRFYRNELCFDNMNGKTTLAREKLNEFIANGYVLSDDEKDLFETWDNIMTYIQANCRDEYNPEFTYGLYQIDEEINVKIQKTDAKGKVHNEPKYGDLNNLIKELKALVKQYYLNNIVDKLFEYEFLK